MALSLRGIGKKIEGLGSKVVAQVNPFDNGRTFQNNTPVAAHQGSVFQQATHNGATNFLGNNVVKPVAQFPIDASQQLYNKAVAPTFNLPKFNNAQQGPNQFVSDAAKKVGATGSLHQTIGSGIQTGLTIGTGGLGNLAEAGATGVAGFVAPKLATRAAVLTSRGLSSEALPVAAKLGIRAAGSGAIGSAFNAAAAAGQGAKPLDIAKSAGVGFALGSSLPVASKVVGSGAKVALKGAQDFNGRATEGAHVVAEKSTGLNRTQLTNDNEANTLRDYVDTITGGKVGNVNQTHAQAHAIGKNIGLDVTSGSPAERGQRVYDYLDKRNKYIQAHDKFSQSGHINPGGQATPEEIGKALGMTDEQITNAINAKDTPVINPDETRAAQTEPKKQFLRSQQENTALNPVKQNIPTVAPGDYEKVRTNTQLVSNPIQVAAQIAAHSINKLSETDKTNFFKEYVEHPETITNADNPRRVQEAIDRFKSVTDTAHANSQALGGNTNYVANYAPHNLDLGTTEAQTRLEDYIRTHGGVADASKFNGIDNQNRIFPDLRTAEAAGFKQQAIDPAKAALDYGNRTASMLRKQALLKGVQKADINKVQARSIDLKNGQTLPISEEGYKQFKSLTNNADPGEVLNTYRKANSQLKSTLLSLSLFHTNNINALQAFPTLVLRGNPVQAARGLGGGYRAIFDTDFSAKLQAQAVKDGTIDAAARIGTPINFGSDFNTTGKVTLSGARGEKAIFERSLPAMHIRFVQAVVKDLEDKGISLDSPQARQYGKEINQVMGFVNSDVQNFDPRVQKGLGDVLLAPQFTRTKWETLRDAFKPGAANNVARQAVVGKYAMEAAIAIAVGHILKQKTDNLQDSLVRNLIHPSITTPFKDSKGNNIELGLPSNYISEAAGLVANATRDVAGRVVPDLNPKNIGGNLANYGRSRLSVLPSTGLKVATNTNYANKPLYDPNMPAGVKAEQGATTIAQGLLPIGLQGLSQSNVVKKHLPGNVQDIINANTAGTNPIVKSVASSVGLTPRTDKTTGKGLDTSRYFESLGNAKQGLNSREKAALEIYAGNKKNPVTGKYDVQPNVNDSATKAKALLDNPKVIDSLIKMNTKLSSQGQKIDPLWGIPKDYITRVLQYQAMPPGGADKTHWLAQNQNWYTPLSDKRTAFFGSLPAGDENKPNQPIEFPTPSKDVAAKQAQFFNITDSAQRAKFLQDNPDIQVQLDKQTDYTNKLRQAQGYGALDTFPTASKDVQKIINTYNAIPKGGGSKGGNKYRSDWIKSHPDEYAKMSQYYTQASLYGLQKEVGQSQFKDTGLSQKGLADVYNLGQYDVQKTTDSNGNTFYALGQPTNNSFGASGDKGSSANPYKYAISRNAAGKVSTPKISVKKPKIATGKIAKAKAFKPKVSIKKAVV